MTHIALAHRELDEAERVASAADSPVPVHDLYDIANYHLLRALVHATLAVAESNMKEEVE